MDTIAAMFNDHPSAAAAIDALVNGGFHTDRISMLVAESDRGHHFKIEAGNKAAQGAIGGGVVGGAVGAIVAGLAATGLILVPGLGLLGVGPVLAALAGLGAGATAGGSLGALVGMGIPEHHAKVMHDQLARGGVLVAIEVSTPEERHAAENTFNAYNASSISRAAA